MKSKKFKKSVDFEESSIKLIDQYIKEKEKIYNVKFSCSYVINDLINKFILTDKSMKFALINVCMNEIEKLNREVIDVNSYSGIERNKLKEHYIDLIKFYSDDEIIEPNEMKKVEIYNGYVQFPKEWGIINEYIAIDSKYVGVIEATITQDLIYHFIYFCNKPIEHLNNIEKIEFEKVCIKKIQNKKIVSLKHYKIPEYDKNNLYYPFGAVIVRY